MRTKIRRLSYYILKEIAFICRIFNHRIYMRLLQKAYECDGVIFHGKASYIHYDAYIDNVGKVELGDMITISVKAIILAHDYSHQVKIIKSGGGKIEGYFSSVIVKDNVFIGAGAILLPGTIIGENSIIGAGAVVKGEIPPCSVVIGNPGKIIKTI